MSRGIGMSDTTVVDGGAAGQPKVGRRIRLLRQGTGKTLRQVAKELGVAQSALSMLENDRTGVSLPRLQLIANYFDVTIGDLLADSGSRNGPDESSKPAHVEIIRQAHSTIPSINRGKGVVYQLFRTSTDSLLQTVLVTFAPGGGFARDKFAHTGDEVVYVLAGVVRMHFGDEIVELAAGDMVHFHTDTPHAFANGSDVGPAMMIAVNSPPW